MSDRETESGESPLRRWSRLKTQARAGQVDTEPADAPAGSGAASQEPGQAEIAADEQTPVLEDLPDIESLDQDSDYTPFLGADVPDELRRLALRKLWASDPVLANLDGLNDYDEDFSTLGTIVGMVTSLFNPGEGMPDPVPEQTLSEPDQARQPEEEMVEAGEDDAELGEDQATAATSVEPDAGCAPQTDTAADEQGPDEPDLS